MSTETSAGTSYEVVHASLVGLSDRLERLRREAVDHLPVPPTRLADDDPWGVAATRLTGALVVLERYAGSVDPTLGRRDWSTRAPAPERLPRQRRRHT
ncbi:MAG TPA: hypothetical protein VF227_01180 [Actinomycetes bacterium]